ncbi:uncharacterized protein BX663DRAFT_514521 [Cokeromyces recurvatus]|uniref:uncharacterized protein n=1 Tax=Cokeromyces recurvatus TaxID=90255 RepID=UPI002220A622|nr:uncharacterized protein BX663DRAFT_514521 [Cokeromyces recurvatus]KAI7901468.1 hypothetical protein BX663DRAFT_514521 [Cokeromyces recurvatus]
MNIILSIILQLFISLPFFFPLSIIKIYLHNQEKDFPHTPVHSIIVSWQHLFFFFSNIFFL